jgi:sulfatase maturation enzyme AslB (radical SAM superfamily)
MDDILIEATAHHPFVDFKTEGRLKLMGKSIPEDAVKIFNPLIEFVGQLKVPHVTFDINLTYFNTASSKKLLELLKQLDANGKIKTILVNWLYEEGDDDSVETAEIYEECLRRTDFRYKEYEEKSIDRIN